MLLDENSIDDRLALRWGYQSRKLRGSPENHSAIEQALGVRPLLQVLAQQLQLILDLWRGGIVSRRRTGSDRCETCAEVWGFVGFPWLEVKIQPCPRAL